MNTYMDQNQTEQAIAAANRQIAKVPGNSSFYDLLGSALSAWAYVVLPLDAAWLVFAIGFPLGFFGSGIFSGLAVYLAELYPTELRGAGQGFGYNIGRGIGAVGPVSFG